MNRKLIIIATLTLLTSLSLFAQDYGLRFAQSSLTGTARYASLGGAFVALGGDQTSILNNPGGLAVYRKSELTFTSSLYNENSDATYYGTKTNDDRFNANVSNFGVIFANNNPDNTRETGWKGVNFGITYNRTNNFWSNRSFSGYNKDNSKTDYYQSYANGNTVDNLNQFYEKLAYDTYLIDLTSNSTTNYKSNMAMPNGGLLQTGTLSSSGATKELQFSLAGNYSNKLYIGASFGIDFLTYSSRVDFTERNYEILDNNILNNFTTTDNLTTTGTGVNVKLGLIYRVTDWLRIGGSYHSPTFYGMHDNFYSTITSNLGSASSDNAPYDYSYRTPQKLESGIALIIKDKGLISADCEFIDYSQAKFTPIGDFTNQNQAIQNNLNQALNLRVGLEWHVEGGMYIRGGYGNYGNPYKATDMNGNKLVDASRQTFSGGIGIRETGYYIDLGYVYTMYNESMAPYQSAQPASLALASNTFLFTIGFKK